ncbi:histidine--tRNA ligase [Candidatus Viridilinea mediisalina]|uniref:Histidine--tRNA ligase n=1 Tax=Candidatus Viridilinea mediisalina TaxID=2024553 RepID=A0A2A6RKZ9_9CHLR|nr:histidine--tRNA ligase [Candidatus Viridilinea mediisalina]PDW03585.1 histidine--tRNA ligase [Candidatus Viridilinea mediisalina]
MATIQNIKGMRDHLPQAMLLRQHIVATLQQVCERYGFDPLQSPVVEYAEVLEGKLGDDEKLIYRFEDHGGRQLALRYDQTVPLARVVAQYAGQLVLPWRRYAYGPSYRGERPARGRYREFYQFDADIVGSSSPLADAEIVALLCEALSALGFPDFVTMLNHRQLIGGIARTSGLDEAAAGGVYRAIDKFDKLGAAGVQEELLRSGVAPRAAEQILALVQIEGDAPAVLEELAARLANDERAVAAVANLRAISEALVGLGIPAERYTVAPRLARGLAYYTGLVFEAITPHWPEGSLLGGGRYDELIGQFAKRSIPTVGLAFGIDRLHDVMEQLGLGPQATGTAVAFVTIFGPEQTQASMALARELRAAGINTLLCLEPTTALGKQFKEADRKGARFALVLGPDELARDTVVLKDLRTGVQEHVERSSVSAKVRSS